MDKLPELEEVKVTCTSKDCDNDKHLYRPKRGEWGKPAAGVCQGCGDTSVDMSIPRARDFSNPSAIFTELGREFIRDHFLTKAVDKKARRIIRRHGIDVIRSRARGRLKSAIGKEPNAFDGRQTPLTGNILYYAQHATATCCRKCAWYWYGISREGELAEADLEFCHNLVQAYLDRREGEICAIHATPAENVE
jgi:hypothetical protein